jgi:mycothiol synthase
MRTVMKLYMHTYQNDHDYQLIREFLQEVFLLNDRRELSWQVYRFDYWRWHGVENMGHGCLESDVFLWKTSEGRLVSVLNREAPGSVFIHVHPDYRTPAFEEEMITVAEEHLTVAKADGHRKIHIWAPDQDRIRQAILQSRGYIKSDRRDYQRYRSLTTSIPDKVIADGYRVRALKGSEEFPARSYLSWRAFHPDEPDNKYQGWHWYENIQRAPLYNLDLDIVAEASDGKLVAFCTVWFDEVTLTGAFEPVGTDPDHRRRGLAGAVMNEGLRRLKELGAERAFVGSWNEATHKLYGSLGFTEYDLLVAWEKTF